MLTLQSARRSDNIRKDSRCCHIGTGTGTFYYKRLFGITVCIKEDGVVLTGEVGKIMIRANRLQPDGRFTVIE